MSKVGKDLILKAYLLKLTIKFKLDKYGQNHEKLGFFLLLKNLKLEIKIKLRTIGKIWENMIKNMQRDIKPRQLQNITHQAQDKPQIFSCK